MKLHVPKRVTLPNGRTSAAGYKRILRDQMQPNIVMTRTYTQRAAPRVEDEDSEDLEFLILSKK